jgi:hypothetical protein
MRQIWGQKVFARSMPKMLEENWKDGKNLGMTS